MTLTDAMQTGTPTRSDLESRPCRLRGVLERSHKRVLSAEVQVLIFYYDVLTGMVSFARNPKGFARKVALKPLANSLYEYERQMNGTLVRRILDYASNRKKPIDTFAIKAANEKWRPHQTRIRGRKELRNIATGHYGKEWERQIELLNGISEKEVLSDAGACTRIHVLSSGFTSS